MECKFGLGGRWTNIFFIKCFPSQNLLNMFSGHIHACVGDLKSTIGYFGYFGYLAFFIRFIEGDTQIRGDNMIVGAPMTWVAKYIVISLLFYGSVVVFDGAMHELIRVRFYTWSWELFVMHGVKFKTFCAKCYIHVHGSIALKFYYFTNVQFKISAI